MFHWLKPKNAPSGPSQTQQNQGQSKKDQLIREAMSNAKVAREAIGEETLGKVRAMMEKQQQAQMEKQMQKQRADAALQEHRGTEVSPMEQAKKILLSMEPEKLATHLKFLKDQDKKFH